jgi:hypothetical protein
VLYEVLLLLLWVVAELLLLLVPSHHQELRVYVVDLLYCQPGQIAGDLRRLLSPKTKNSETVL